MAAPALKGMSVTAIRMLTLAVTLALWELVARSGWLYQDVVPPLEKIALAFGRLLIDPLTYRHLAVTAAEVSAGFALGFAADALEDLVALQEAVAAENIARRCFKTISDHRCGCCGSHPSAPASRRFEC